MKYTFAVAMSIVLLACQGNTQNKRTELKTTQDSVSYVIGMNIGHNIKAQKVDVSIDAIAMGIEDVTTADTSHKPLINDDQAEALMMAFQQRMTAKQEEESKSEGVKNKAAGDAFLAANKTKEGVVTTASGLQYKVITMGKGPKPKPEQTVSVHYRGTTIDGTEFDSSYKRNQPATFGVGQVIAGWTEALQLMPVGSKWELYIPSELAYGERGAGNNIGPNSVLIFEVELLSVN